MARQIPSHMHVHRDLFLAVGSVVVIPLILFSCTSPRTHGAPEGSKARTKLVLPASLEPRRDAFALQVDSALEIVRSFAHDHGWDSLVVEAFMDSVMVFDRKPDFDHQLLVLAEADTTLELPATYCGALERRTLLVASPAYYAEVYPEGIEPHSWVKLLAHEIAHRLHVRILRGDEEAMGPIWFYEGFAIHAADQLRNAAPVLDSTAMRAVMDDPERGSYAAYGAVFTYFEQRLGLDRMLQWAEQGEPVESLWEVPSRPAERTPLPK